MSSFDGGWSSGSSRCSCGSASSCPGCRSSSPCWSLDPLLALGCACCDFCPCPSLLLPSSALCLSSCPPLLFSSPPLAYLSLKPGGMYLIWMPASLCPQPPSLCPRDPGPPTSHRCCPDQRSGCSWCRPGPVCPKVWRFFRCSFSAGCQVASPSIPSLCAGAPTFAPSPAPPSGAPLPAYVGIPPAAEAGLIPPSVEPAPAFPVPHVLPSLSPAAAASVPGDKDNRKDEKILCGWSGKHNKPQVGGVLCIFVYMLYLDPGQQLSNEPYGLQVPLCQQQPPLLHGNLHLQLLLLLLLTSLCPLHVLPLLLLLQLLLSLPQPLLFPPLFLLFFLLLLPPTKMNLASVSLLTLVNQSLFVCNAIMAKTHDVYTDRIDRILPFSKYTVYHMLLNQNEEFTR